MSRGGALTLALKGLVLALLEVATHQSLHKLALIVNLERVAAVRQPRDDFSVTVSFRFFQQIVKLERKGDALRQVGRPAFIAQTVWVDGAWRVEGAGSPGGKRHVATGFRHCHDQRVHFKKSQVILLGVC